MNDKHLTIIGSIIFFEKKTDGIDKAFVNRIDAHKQLTESEAEKLISDGTYVSYLIPDLYKGEIEYLDEWTCTDPDCNQYRKDIDGSDGYKYLFREDRCINPETGETETYESEIDLNDYTWHEKVEACETFGYTAKQVDAWLAEGEELELIAECIFEMEN